MIFPVCLKDISNLMLLEDQTYHVIIVLCNVHFLHIIIIETLSKSIFTRDHVNILLTECSQVNIQILVRQISFFIRNELYMVTVEKYAILPQSPRPLVQ